jgi:hypothetical protein
MKQGRSITQDDRAQAFTLEGLVGSVIILTAVLFAIQSVIITPTTGGSVNPEIRGQVEQETNDILVTTARKDTFGLSEFVRYWAQERRTFAGAVNPAIGYGTQRPPNEIGELLNQTFTQNDRRYNMYMRYRPKNLSNGTQETTIVYRGQPSDSAVTASYAITLYDNETLTAPNASQQVELWQYGTTKDSPDGYYPIPNAVDGPVYNVVEVRLIVW